MNVQKYSEDHNIPLDFSIIIVNYNGCRFFTNLFESLLNLRHEPLEYEIIVVDNASSDDSVKQLQTVYSPQFKHFKIIKSKKNLGFAKGNNLGVKHSKGKYLVFLNNDTKVDQDWLVALHGIISKQDVIVTAKLVFFHDFIKLKTNAGDEVSREYTLNDKVVTIDCRFVKNAEIRNETVLCRDNTEIFIPLCYGNSAEHKFRFTSNNSPLQINFNNAEHSERVYTLIQNAGSRLNEKSEGEDIGFGCIDSESYNIAKYVECACGASMCVRAETFKMLKGFDPVFFMYYEDTDFCFRARKLGVLSYYEPKAFVRHVHTGSSSGNSKLFVFYVTRNKNLFLVKNTGYTVYRTYLGRSAIALFKLVVNVPKLLKSTMRRARVKAYLSLFLLIPWYILDKILFSIKASRRSNRS